MTVNRADLQPGQIVEVRQRYVVGTKRYPPADHERADPRPGRAGNRKLYPTGEPADLVIVRGRWRVYQARVRAAAYLPRWHKLAGWQYLHNGIWIAELTDPNVSSTPLDWEHFQTHAEAIAYADRQARRPL